MVYSGDGFFVLFKPPKCVCEPWLGYKFVGLMPGSMHAILHLRPNTTIGVARYVHQMGIEDTDHVTEIQSVIRRPLWR